MTQETNIEGRGLAPIPMVLFCPACGLQHVDGPDNNFTGDANWTNPPHRSHACQRCGCIWRPADVATTGVAAVQSKGKADTWDTSRTEMAPISIEVRKREAVEGELEQALERVHSAEARSGRNLARAEAAEARANSIEAEVERLQGEVALGDMRASYDELMVEHRHVRESLNSLEGKLKVAREALEPGDLAWLRTLVDDRRMDIRIVNSGVAKMRNDRINRILTALSAIDSQES
jgi:hypothetical protein